MPYLIQRAIALLGLVVLGPLILILAGAVRLTSPGSAFHRATRVRPGGTFTLYKLRTMRADAAEAGPGITVAGDARVTRLGRLLRRTKLDELPQLWNVVRGDMALVGPRPEDPRYVDLADPVHARVFGALPGITGPTALQYRNEEAMLATAAAEMARRHRRRSATPEDLDRAYREVVLPGKLASDATYLAHRSSFRDIRILLDTIQLRGSGAIQGQAPAVLDYFVEWGGAPWRHMVGEALVAMGDLEGKRVLEIGPRSGRMSSLFALRGAQVVAVDITNGFEREAIAQAERCNVANRLTFRVDDGTLTSVVGETFDVIFTKSVLVMIADRRAYLNRVVNLLHPDGIFVAIENGRGGRLADLLRRLRRSRWDYRQIHYMDECDIEEMSGIFAAERIIRHFLPPIWLFVGRRRRGDPLDSPLRDQRMSGDHSRR